MRSGRRASLLLAARVLDEDGSDVRLILSCAQFVPKRFVQIVALLVVVQGSRMTTQPHVDSAQVHQNQRLQNDISGVSRSRERLLPQRRSFGGMALSLHLGSEGNVVVAACDVNLDPRSVKILSAFSASTRASFRLSSPPSRSRSA